MKRRGKVFALSTMAIGVVVLAAAGITSRERLVEQYYLIKLESQDSATRLEAARTLFEIGSDRTRRRAEEVMEEWVRSIPMIKVRIPLNGVGPFQ